MNKKSALFIDIQSIQEYVYSSNKLKHNIGASYIVKSVLDVELVDTLKSLFSTGEEDNIGSFSESSTNTNNTLHKDYEIVYVAGGNALIFFQNDNKRKEFVKTFTETILYKYPGLKIAFGLLDDFDINNFSKSMSLIHESLQRNKATYFPNITLGKYGITAECPESNESAETFVDSENRYISGVIMAKIKAKDKAEEQILRDFSNILKDRYIFVSDLDKISTDLGKNYMAIVHIDGNRMGEKIRKCNSMKDLQNLSSFVKNKVFETFKSMINELVKLIENKVITEENGFPLKTDDNKIILPIRPLLIGGDDITFICDGRLGLFLTEIFLRKFKKYTEEIGLSACAGICLVKKKHPFYRAYKVVEGLIHSAKSESRKHNDKSFIDFCILSGGISGYWEDIREQYFKGLEGSTHFGPYCIDDDENVKSIKNLRKIILHFSNWPKNKLYVFRNLLFENREKVQRFAKDMELRGYSLPEIDGMVYHSNIWQDEKTPYFDAIELLEFYPKELIMEIDKDGTEN